MASHDRETLEAALIGYEQREREIDRKIQDILSKLGGVIVPNPQKTPKVRKAGRKGRKPLSPEARLRMAAGQQKRWAAKRTAETEVPAEGKTATKKTAVKKPSKMSAEGRERIAAAQRARWAKAKKAPKK